MKNKTYRRAALEKLFLIALLLLLIVWILNAQDAVKYPSTTANGHDSERISLGDMYARLVESDKARHASIEPTRITRKRKATK